ncbi:MAG: FHA domain-containing protein [Chloroflexota bacterium]
MDARINLVIKSGTNAGRVFRVVRFPAVLGSDPAADIALSDAMVAAKHAELRFLLGRLVIADLGAPEGVFVNGQRIASLARLQPGDVLRLGNTLLGVQIGGSAKPSEPAPLVAGLPEESKVPPFGFYLFKRGVVTPEQLAAAAQRQAEFRELGQKKALGQVLLEMGYVTREQLEQAAREQQDDFRELHADVKWR